MTFVDKVAVITGATSGIGKETALQLAQLGCHLAIIARHRKNLKATQREFKKTGSRVEIYVCDISQPAQVRDTFQKIKKDFSTIDYLVNNAAFNASLPLAKTTIKLFDQEIATTLKGNYLCAINAYPLMPPGSAIVNIGSIRGIEGSKKTSPGYAAAKAGIINLTKTFAFQLAKQKIRVNCVSPGPVHSTGTSKKWPAEKRHQAKISPQDVTETILFLLSDSSQNNQILVLN